MNATVDIAPAPAPAPAPGSIWRALTLLWPHVWRYRARVGVAFAFLVVAKLAVIGVSLVMARLVDALNVAQRPLVLPLVLLGAYGLLRLSGTLFQELRGVVFARVMARTSRQVALRVFEHLHALSLRFHLDRRTGAV
ncbi:MAG: hypothetical protein JNJ74_11915, partial [Xanthomonadales bacterium]|nr:hypothetical protein [Xanthomonadales bacterium]